MVCLVLCLIHGDPSINSHCLSPSPSFFSTLVHFKHQYTKVSIAKLHCFSCLRDPSCLGIFWLIGVRVQLGTGRSSLEATGRSPSELLALSNAPPPLVLLSDSQAIHLDDKNISKHCFLPACPVRLSIPQKSCIVWQVFRFQSRLMGISGRIHRDTSFYLDFYLAVFQVLICNGQITLEASCVGEKADFM